MSGHHELLGVEPGATEEELKKAYREMVKVWHPDRFAEDPALQKKAKEKLQKINEAYEILMKPAAAAPSMIVYPQPEERPAKLYRSPWPLFIALGLAVVLTLYAVLKNSNSPSPVNTRLFSQQSNPIPSGSTNRYWLQSATGTKFYIIEGPRVPLEWEIEALVEAYDSQTPKTKQSLGQFTISQSAKPDNSDLIPLRYRLGEK